MSETNGHTNGRAGKPKPQRQYTEDDKATALAVLAANGGNVLRTARELGIPEPTVRHWKDGVGINSAVVRGGEVKKVALASIFEQVARKYLDQAGNDAVVGKTNGRDAVIAAATAVDKMRLLRGEPTSIHQQDLVELNDDELERRIAECQAGTAAAEARATPPAC